MSFYLPVTSPKLPGLTHSSGHSATPKSTSSVCSGSTYIRFKVSGERPVWQLAQSACCHEQLQKEPSSLSTGGSHRRHSLSLPALAHAESQPQQQQVANFVQPEDELVYGAEEGGSAAQEGFCVVNFYHLTDIDQPHAVVASHRRWLKVRDIQGRIYISSQGINAQLSGPETDAHEYAKWVSKQHGFQVDLGQHVSLARHAKLQDIRLLLTMFLLFGIPSFAVCGANLPQEDL